MSLCVLRALVAFMAIAPAVHASGDFLAADQAFRLEARPTPQGLTLHWTIAPGYYLYRDRIDVRPDGAGTVESIRKPSGERKDDPQFGAVDVYHGEVTVLAQVSGARHVQVGWQGCAEAGLCYMPQQQRVATGAAPPAAPAAEPASADFAGLEFGSASDGAFARLLQERTFAWVLLVFAGLGIALAFTPCMLPMLPILSTIVVGEGASSRRALGLSVGFVLPMASTYALLGVLAAQAGTSVQAWLQSSWTNAALSAAFVVLAAAMFGLFTLQLPAAVRDRLGQASARRRGGSLAGVAVLGILSALFVGPCMTAPLAGALIYVAQSGDRVKGGLALLALGLGMGLPLIVAATLGGRWMPGPGPWMDRVKSALGFGLLAMAVWTLRPVAQASLLLALWGVLLLGAALAVMQAASVASERVRIAGRAAAWAGGVWGVAMLVGAASGAGDPWQPLAGWRGSEARPAASAQAMSTPTTFAGIRGQDELRAALAQAAREGKAALLDFSADWCVSCKTIDREVFSDTSVQSALQGVVRLRADVTSADEAMKALMQEWQVQGPPTLLLFDSQGAELRAARLVGEFGRQDLLSRLQSTNDSGAKL
jgi:thiol:disulfide interchange protein DsbD